MRTDLVPGSEGLLRDLLLSFEDVLDLRMTALGVSLQWVKMGFACRPSSDTAEACLAGA